MVFKAHQVYKNTLERSWAECFLGFNKVLMSWSSIQLETLVQRVEVLRLFLISKLWYKASALPLPSKFAKKIESAMLRFLLKVKLEKFNNSHSYEYVLYTYIVHMSCTHL